LARIGAREKKIALLAAGAVALWFYWRGRRAAAAVSIGVDVGDAYDIEEKL